MESTGGFADRFVANTREKRLIEGQARVLLAVSGGVDSMAMARLFFLSGNNFGLAHCNFSLRGEDSDLDEQLVKRTALILGVPFYSATFDTKAYARDNKLTIQEAAREIRYQFLQETALEFNYELIATAHHLDDSIETMLINLLRGTGIKGLAGIPEKRDNIIRPMLFATRAEIEAFALHENIEFRTDQSNEEDKYLRNRIRHYVIPTLRELNPRLHQTMQDFFENMKFTVEFLEHEVNLQKGTCVFPEREGISIDIKKLRALSQPRLSLFELLKDYNFSGRVCNELFASFDSQPGKLFFSKTHKAVKDRDKIFVFPIKTEVFQEELLIDEDTRHREVAGINFWFETKMHEPALQFPGKENTAMLDFDLLQFPLVLRKLQPGDWLIPMGMKGKKKVSDLLTDKKTPLHLKQNVWVLTSKGEIAWVAGFRISEKFKLRTRTRKVFIAKMLSL
jgi:tRNA(Ile)-lysidine synthase